MGKAVMFLSIAVFLLTKAIAQTGAQGLSFHGNLPLQYVRSPKPVGDGGPNDIYSYVQKRGRSLTENEFVIYPARLGLELSQDSELKVYEVFDANSLKNDPEMKMMKKHDIGMMSDHRGMGDVMQMPASFLDSHHGSDSSNDFKNMDMSQSVIPAELSSKFKPKSQQGDYGGNQQSLAPQNSIPAAPQYQNSQTHFPKRSNSNHRHSKSNPANPPKRKVHPHFGG